MSLRAGAEQRPWTSHLDKAGITYSTVDVSIDTAAVEKLRELGYTQAPVVITETDHWSGFRPDKISELAAA